MEKDAFARRMYRKIEDHEMDLESAKDGFLRACGWDHRCDYPGSLWLWSKALPDGRIVAVGRETAIHMEEASNESIYDPPEENAHGETPEQQMRSNGIM